MTGEIRIPAAVARTMTGWCGHHQCALSLVTYADDGLDDVLDAWQCPRYGQDPGLDPLREALKELEARPGWLPMGNPNRRAPELNAERHRLWDLMRPIAQRCPDSWVLIIPGTGAPSAA